MPIDKSGFKRTDVAGLRWNSRQKRALFRVDGAVRVGTFASLEHARVAFEDFRRSLRSPAAAPVTTSASLTRTKRNANPTLDEYVGEFWVQLHASCRESTVRTNDRAYKNYLSPFFGQRFVRDIDESDCEDFVAAQSGRSPYTINLALRVLRKILNHARRRKLRGDLPDSMHFVKENLLKLEMTEDEQDRFLNAFGDRAAFRQLIESNRSQRGKVVRSKRFGFRERAFGGGLRPDSDAADIYFQRFSRSKVVFVAAIDLGLRITDLRLLKRRSLDLRRGVVTVITEKTGKAAVVALSARCRELIESALRDDVSNSDYIFSTPEGQPYSESTLRRYFEIAKTFAGITRRCRWNDLRHTFASNLASEGLSLLDIRDALGHTTARMSERYAKPNEHAIERMRAALDARHARRQDNASFDAQRDKTNRRRS